MSAVHTQHEVFHQALQPYLQRLRGPGAYGGGSAAAAVGAVGAALAMKAVDYSAGKNEKGAGAPLHQHRRIVQRLQARLLASVDSDAALFRAYLKAPGPREKERALKRSSCEIRLVLQLCNAVIESIRAVYRKISPQIYSDVLIAFVLCESACAASCINLRTNNALQKKKSFRIPVLPWEKKLRQNKRLFAKMRKGF